VSNTDGREAERVAREIVRKCEHVYWPDAAFSAGGPALADAACWRCCDQAIAAALTALPRGD